MRGSFWPIQTLSRRMFRKNRGRNIVAVLAILMTTLMFTTLFTLAQSMSRNMIEMTFRQTGYNAQASIKSITDEELEAIDAHPSVKETGESIVAGIAENKELRGRQTEIRWADESYASHSFAEPTTGTMPKEKGEIAVDTFVLDRLGIPHKLGETVTLQWRKDMNSEEMTSSTFTLCGFWEGNESVYASMAWVSRPFIDEVTKGVVPSKDQALGMHMAQVTLESDRNIEETMDGILADTDLTGLEYSVNLAYSPEMNAGAFAESVPMYLGMILVFIAGYLIIYNIFQISVAADVQFYGKVKTLGMTTKQIKKMIYSQANRLCLMGIPIGLIAGWLLGVVLVPVLMGTVEGEAVVSANPVIFIGSAAFAWITVLISCLRPARMAGKISPIEALRMSDAADKGKRKVKKRRGKASLKQMAWSNLWRNKKRTITVICSLSLGLVLLSCFYAKDAAFDMEKYLSELTIADFELTDSSSEDYNNGYDPQGTTLTEELIEEMESARGVEAAGHQYSHTVSWQMDEGTRSNVREYYTEDRLKEWESYDAGGAEAARNAIQTGKVNAVLYGVDGIPLDALTQDYNMMAGSFDPQAFAAGDYILAIGPAAESTEVMPVPDVGSSVIIEGKSYQVMAVVEPITSVEEGAPEMGFQDGMEMEFVIPSDTFQEQWPDNTLRKFFLNVKDSQVDQVQEMLDAYTESVDTSLPVTSRKSMAEQYEAETRSAAVMGNAISVVIALVGVLNFINSMVTAIVSRKREFAMIQSIGMTKKQLCRMLVYEGLFYAALTLAVSYIVSALAVEMVVRAMTASEFSTFHFTLLPLGICTPILLVTAVLIPYLCFRNLEKQSVVERLRIE